MSVAENADPNDAADQMAEFVHLMNRKSGKIHWTPIGFKTVNDGCRSCGKVCTVPQQNIREDCEEVKPEHVKVREARERAETAIRLSRRQEQERQRENPKQKRERRRAEREQRRKKDTTAPSRPPKRQYQGSSVFPGP
jgi:hypothetical protein